MSMPHEYWGNVKVRMVEATSIKGSREPDELSIDVTNNSLVGY